jgi:hypothetical protein
VTVARKWAHVKTSCADDVGRPSPSVRQTTTQDGAVLLDIEQGVCFSINAVGAKIWEMLKQSQSLNQIVDDLAAEFSVPKEQIRNDVIEFVAELNRQHVLLIDSNGRAQRYGFFRNLARRLKVRSATASTK